MIEETVFLTRGNSIDLLMIADGQPEAIQSTTRVVLKCENEDSGAVTTLDSSTSPSYFDWASRGADGYLILKLGASSLTVGTYTVKCFVYNSNVPEGLYWGIFRLFVRNVG